MDRNAIAQKISNARQLSGLSLQALANELGVSKQMIAKYEQGISLPSSTGFIKLAKVLGVKVDYFFSKVSVNLGKIDFRKKSAFPQKKQQQLKAQIRQMLERYLEVEELLNLNTPFGNPLAGDAISSLDDIKSLAAKLRKTWSIGTDPLHNIVQMLEDKGIKVIEVNEVENEFDGLATWVNDVYPVVVINQNDCTERKRFTLLHELGHLLLPLENESHKQAELYCNRFAAEMLFPESFVMQEFGKKRNGISLQEFIDVQKKYGISIQAIVYRLVDCGIFSTARKVQFYKRLSINANLKAQVNESRFLSPEKSSRFEQLVYRAYAEALISASKAAALLNVNVNVVLENALL
jgi:Zn-dependent peptidase ImmA (M78 family)